MPLCGDGEEGIEALQEVMRKRKKNRGGIKRKEKRKRKWSEPVGLSVSRKKFMVSHSDILVILCFSNTARYHEGSQIMQLAHTAGTRRWPRFKKC